MGSLFDRKSKPDPEVAAISEYDRSISKVYLIFQLRINALVFASYKYHSQLDA